MGLQQSVPIFKRIIQIKLTGFLSPLDELEGVSIVWRTVPKKAQADDPPSNSAPAVRILTYNVV